MIIVFGMHSFKVNLVFKYTLSRFNMHNVTPGEEMTRTKKVTFHFETLMDCLGKQILK